MKGAPPGAIHACYPSGWVQLELFPQWFEHVKPSATSPVSLILDGHTSHTRNIKVVELGYRKPCSLAVTAATLKSQNTVP